MKFTHKTATVTFKQVVEAHAAAILAEIDANRFEVQTFSELHDLCDANMLGGAELLGHLFPSEVEEGEAQYMFDCQDIIIASQDLVNSELARRAAAEPKMRCEGEACECSEAECQGAERCAREASAVLFSVDVHRVVGTAFCPDCAAVAIQSGSFRTGEVRS